VCPVDSEQPLLLSKRRAVACVDARNVDQGHRDYARLSTKQWRMEKQHLLIRDHQHARRRAYAGAFSLDEDLALLEKTELVQAS
jgi:hypothetical protein